MDSWLKTGRFVRSDKKLNAQLTDSSSAFDLGLT